MATKQDLIKARNDPNVLKFLNLIARAEGTEKYGYNTAFGGDYFGDLSQHPNIKKNFKQTDGKVNSSGASGRYQFLNSTWNGLSKKYGFEDFGAVNQDLGAIALITEKGALKDVQSGNYKKAIDKLGNIWASFPSSPYKQHKRSYEYLLGKEYAANTPQSLGSALNYNPASVEQAYQDVLNNYQPQPEVPVVDQGVISGVAKAPNLVDQQYGYNTGLADVLGVMANPTPSQENIGVMSPLASVLFKA